MKLAFAMNHPSTHREIHLNNFNIYELSDLEIATVSGGEALPPLCNTVSSCLSLIINGGAVINGIMNTFKPGNTPPEAQPNWESIGASQQTASAGSTGVTCSVPGTLGKGDSVYKNELP